jgi:hypothetical protein
MRQCLVGLALLASITAPARAEPAIADPELSAVRAASERFRDVRQALAEGYTPAPGNMCEKASMMGRQEALGAMGVHYFRPDLLGITAPPSPRVDGNGMHTAFMKPAILIYEPQADGALELVAVENLVFIKAWEAAGNKAPPSFRGKSFDRMQDDPSTPVDEAHMFEPHYDLHVWLYRENPNGIFAQFNPAVSCAHGQTHMAGNGQHGAGR